MRLPLLVVANYVREFGESTTGGIYALWEPQDAFIRPRG